MKSSSPDILIKCPDPQMRGLIQNFLTEVAIALDDGYPSIHFHQLSGKKYSDITQTPYRELTIRFYRKGDLTYDGEDDE